MAGMWEIPMPFYYEPGTDVSYYQNMDYPFSLEIMNDNFSRRYNGNRSPLWINCHAPWLGEYGADLKTWIEGILDQHNDVYFITNKQLLEYMKNPVSKEEFAASQLCTDASYDDSFCFPDGYRCEWNEKWDAATCECVCADGYCSLDGTCVQPGVWGCEEHYWDGASCMCGQ